MEGYGALQFFNEEKLVVHLFQSATGRRRFVNAICPSGSCRQFSTIGR
jgi:hypothetical protein